jgi:hypothetical protein
LRSTNGRVFFFLPPRVEVELSLLLGSFHDSLPQQVEFFFVCYQPLSKYKSVFPSHKDEDAELLTLGHMPYIRKLLSLIPLSPPYKNCCRPFFYAPFSDFRTAKAAACLPTILVCCASTASMMTSAAIPSTIGMARGTTHGSCLPFAARTPSAVPS